MAKSIYDKLRVKPGSKLRLKDWDPEDTFGWAEEEARDRTESNVQKMFELQGVMAAESKKSMLVVLQAMDAAGKDGSIRNVMRGLNPQGCRVTSFKAPTAEELDHDFLWRVHAKCPRRGEIGIFNRSHYEDVLVVRVREFAPKKVWKARYELINQFESLLATANCAVRKFYLHISKDEQKKQLEERLADPQKHWKFNLGDLDERKRWDGYMEAYEDALRKCSTSEAPWFIIPANRKWFRDLAISEILVDTMKSLDCKFPKPAEDLSGVVVE